MNWDRLDNEGLVQRIKEMEELLLNIRSKVQNTVSYRDGGQVVGTLVIHSYDVAKRMLKEIDYVLREED